jgi:hypothetical protein
MDEVARLRPRDRADLFNEAAREKKTLRAEVIEKDFWVCFALRAIFTLPDPPAGLIFKGGTSLSKVWNAIERFSEDVDLSFDRVALGYGGEKDPTKAASKKKREQRLDELRLACQKMIGEKFSPALVASLSKSLNSEPGEGSWEVTNDPSDADGQTLLFRYPTGLGRAADLPYVRPVVRLEMGARGEQWPAESAVIRPYAAEALPTLRLWKKPESAVLVLAAERTFWEKATLLHKWHHCPEAKPLPEKQSRHYYDVVKLFRLGVGARAVANLELLRQVTEHQKVFFHTPWARFDEAIPGTLRLVPRESRRRELERDYDAMRREMIFGEAPGLDEILAVLEEIETLVNNPT